MGTSDLFVCPLDKQEVVPAWTNYLHDHDSRLGHLLFVEQAKQIENGYLTGALRSVLLPDLMRRRARPGYFCINVSSCQELA